MDYKLVESRAELLFELKDYEHDGAGLAEAEHRRQYKWWEQLQPHRGSRLAWQAN